MALLTRDEIVAALERLGQLAAIEGQVVQLVVAGGAAMVLGYSARLSTHDVDAVVLPPVEAAAVRRWAGRVAHEFHWPSDWLNDAVKGYLVDLSPGPTLLSSPGIEVCRPSTEQLLAMKLCAWRDDVDISDASRLLKDLELWTDRETLWKRILPFLLPGRELKAQLALQDLWENRDADH